MSHMYLAALARRGLFRLLQTAACGSLACAPPKIVPSSCMFAISITNSPHLFWLALDHNRFQAKQHFNYAVSVYGVVMFSRPLPDCQPTFHLTACPQPWPCPLMDLQACLGHKSDMNTPSTVPIAPPPRPNNSDGSLWPPRRQELRPSRISSRSSTGPSAPRLLARSSRAPPTAGCKV